MSGDDKSFAEEFAQKVDEAVARFTMLDLNEFSSAVLKEALIRLGYYVPVIGTQDAVRQDLQGAGLSFAKADICMNQILLSVQNHHTSLLTGECAAARRLSEVSDFTRARLKAKGVNI